MGLLSSVVNKSIKLHFLPFALMVVVQCVMGNLLAHAGRLEVGPLMLWKDMGDWLIIQFGRDVIATGELYEWHRLLAWSLIVFSGVLVLEKMYILLGGLKRGLLRNPFVDAHIRYHFFGLAFALAIQFASSSEYRETTRVALLPYAPEAVQPYLAAKHPALRIVHQGSAYLILGFTVILILEKLYLVFGNRPATTAQTKAKRS